MQGTQIEVQDDRQARKLGWWCYFFDCDDDNDEFIGNCAAALADYEDANGELFYAHTGYDLTPEITFTYPCSAGYLRNFAANENLFDDVRHALNDALSSSGANCANLCDIDNGSYATPEAEGFGTIANLGGGVGDLFCEGGVLAANSQAGFSDTTPCDCTDSYLAGCEHCSGTVTFKVKSCADTSNA